MFLSSYERFAVLSYSGEILAENSLVNDHNEAFAIANLDETLTAQFLREDCYLEQELYSLDLLKQDVNKDGVQKRIDNASTNYWRRSNMLFPS